MNLGTTLCWYCQNSVPSLTTGCSWSEDLKPVEGWRAERRDLKYDTHMMESYIVHWCPQYKREKRREYATY